MFHYVAKINNGTEWYEDSDYALCNKTLAERAIHKAKITTSRINPKVFTVEVFKLAIMLGSVERIPLGSVDATPPFAPMTDEEYKDEMYRILSDVPKPFRPFIANHAWREGNNSGFEEMVHIASGLIGEILPAIKAFEKEILDS